MSCTKPITNGVAIIPIDIGKLDKPRIVPKCRRPKYSPRIACSNGVRAPNPTPQTTANTAAIANELARARITNEALCKSNKNGTNIRLFVRSPTIPPTS